MSENKIATKADLQRMYNKMLPYLGGMPEMVTNKFSKGDLYSTEEKMIGQWIDGKPLYQKSFNVTLSSTTAISSTSTTNIFYGIIDISSIVQNIDKCLVLTDKSYYIINTTTRGFVACWYESPASIFVMTLFSRENIEGHFTIQYTKITDSPISIGSDTDYSTEEKIVGTWIDGKPLYQKTVDFGALPNKTIKEVAHNVTNIDKILFINSFAVSSSNEQTIPLSLSFDDETGGVMIAVTKTNVKILCRLKDYSSAYPNTYVTFQYTKTTD